MPKVEDDQVGSGIAEHPGQQGEVVILDKNDRRLVVHLVQNGVGKLAINHAILIPVAGIEARPCIGHMAERPKPFVGESVVVALLFLFGQPDAPQRVSRILRRHAQTVARVHHFGVGITASVRHPSPVAIHNPKPIRVAIRSQARRRFRIHHRFPQRRQILFAHVRPSPVEQHISIRPQRFHAHAVICQHLIEIPRAAPM